jgi:hypothetical protein
VYCSANEAATGAPPPPQRPATDRSTNTPRRPNLSGDAGAAQQADAADEAGASDGASQLIRGVRRTMLEKRGVAIDP